MTANIGIFAPAGNVQAGMLRNALRDIGCRAHFFDINLPPEERVVLDGDRAKWNGIDLMKLDTAYVHGVAHESPVVPDSGGMKDWSVWQADYPEKQQKYSFLGSLFTRMERCGVRLLNPPDAQRAMFAGLHLLNELKRADVPVPEFLSTNDPEKAEAFAAGIETLVWRPQNGRAAWQLCLKRQREALVRPDAPPPILAEAKHGPIVRCWFFENEPLMSLSSAPPSDRVPERLERFTPFDHAPYRDDLAHLARTAGIPWFQTLFVPEGGRAWVYSVDADPIIDHLPESFRTPLVAALAERTTGRTGKPLLPDAPASRPAIFLQRMLRVLFEFERCKYGPEK